jgi:hypothetical protein
LGTATYFQFHDAARNMTFDGEYALVYDAWNRLVGVQRAFRPSAAALTQTTTVATMQYDGLRWRTVKAIANSSADWDFTYHYYYDGQRMVELRDDSSGAGDIALKQYVWGQGYVDEIVEIAVNGDPTTDSDCMEASPDARYYPLQDANYNVLGLVDKDGDLVERYEYTPYGPRTNLPLTRSIDSSFGDRGRDCFERHHALQCWTGRAAARQAARL